MKEKRDVVLLQNKFVLKAKARKYGIEELTINLTGLKKGRIVDRCGDKVKVRFIGLFAWRFYRTFIASIWMDVESETDKYVIVIRG